MIRPFRSLAALAGLLLLTVPAAAKVPVKSVAIEKSNDAYDITFDYPKTGVKAIDDDIGAWVKKTVDDFIKTATEDRADGDSGYGLDVSFEVLRNDAGGFGVLFTEEYDTGGAHPNHDFDAFNYLMPDGWRVYLPELFDRKALGKISAFAIKDLTAQLTLPDGSGDTDTIADGAGPDWDNFKDFILLPGKLEIHFPPYQVASYAAGEQESDVPLSLLSGLTRPDPRAPAPSFDCAAATTRVEKLICSDVELARLDRKVAEAYASNLKYAADDAAQADLKQKQQVWLGQRDASCTGADALACLRGGYETRLEDLNKPAE